MFNWLVVSPWSRIAPLSRALSTIAVKKSLLMPCRKLVKLCFEFKYYNSINDDDDNNKKFHFSASRFQKLGNHELVWFWFYLWFGLQNFFCTGDCLEARFLFQRISVTTQRFNAILLKDSFLSDTDKQDWWPFQLFLV